MTLAEKLVQLRPTLLRAASFIGGATDPEDLVQEATIRALSEPNPPPLEECAAWVKRVMRNLAIDDYRRRKCRADDVWQATASRFYYGAGDSPSTDQDFDIRRAIDSLRPIYRGAVEAVYIRGATCVEAGEELGVCTNTVKTRLRQARRMMRGHFDTPECQ